MPNLSAICRKTPSTTKPAKTKASSRPASIRQRIFQTNLVVTALKLDAQGKLEKNPDGSYKQTQLTIPLVAAIDPLRGKFVARISQTGTAILNPQNPVLTAVPSLSEVEMMEK